jgi:hypothetical protein
MKHMPKIMRDELKKAGGSRSFSTSARSRMPDVQGVEPNNEFIPVPGAGAGQGIEASDEAAAALASMIEQVQEQALEQNPGLKFDEPVLPSNIRTLNFRKRYDTLQDQFTKMMMESGKLTRAQKVHLFPADGYLTGNGLANSSRICPSFWTTSAPPPLHR